MIPIRLRSLVPVLLVTLSSEAHARPERTPVSPPPMVPAAPAAAGLEELLREFRETKNPVAGLAAARALAQSRRLLEASALYVEVSQLVLPLEAPAAAIDARARAAVERQELVRRIPAVVITVESERADSVQVFLNGAPIPRSELGSWRPADPGTVQVRGVLGALVIERDVELREGDMKPVRLVFTPERRPVADTVPPQWGGPRASSTRGLGAAQIGSYVAIGLGTAALVTGGVFGVLALQDEAELQSRCVRNRCAASLEPEVDAYESRKTISTVGLAAGAALVLGGAAVYLGFGGSSGASSAARIGAFCSADRAGVWGRF